MDYKNAWIEQKDFMRSSMNWMDAVIKTANSEEEKLQAFVKKEALKIMLERMEKIENKK